MKIETFKFATDEGWSVESFPKWDSDSTLVIIFGDPDLISAPQLLRDISNIYPNSHVIGCSSGGEISGTSLLENSLVVAVVKFDKTTVISASARIDDPDDSFAAGEVVGNQLKRPDLRGVFILSKGREVNGSKLVQGLSSKLPKSVTITGGLAGHGESSETTWILSGGQLENDYVSAIGLCGDSVRINHSYGSGWMGLGMEYQVTRSDGNILYELDEKPALQIYKKYLGEDAVDLCHNAFFFPLGVRTGSGPEHRVVRTVDSVNEGDQSMRFFGDIPSGSMVKVLWGQTKQLVQGAEMAISAIANSFLNDLPTLYIVISCIGRKVAMGHHTEEELHVILSEFCRKRAEQLDGDTLIDAKEEFADTVCPIGFYSYGELSPHSDGTCALHNQTITFTTISEVT